jgi:hypothetical protein
MSAALEELVDLTRAVHRVAEILKDVRGAHNPRRDRTLLEEPVR